MQALRDRTWVPPADVAQRRPGSMCRDIIITVISSFQHHSTPVRQTQTALQ